MAYDAPVAALPKQPPAPVDVLIAAITAGYTDPEAERAAILAVVGAPAPCAEPWCDAAHVLFATWSANLAIHDPEARMATLECSNLACWADVTATKPSAVEAATARAQAANNWAGIGFLGAAHPGEAGVTRATFVLVKPLVQENGK
jgi:hypothetical protein